MTDSSSKFNTSKEYISSKLFIPQRPRQGSWTTFNITVLPDYLAYIKKQLNKQELLRLSDYHLQTYLLEAALKKQPDSDFDKCTQKIISHIRTNKQFWLQKTGQAEENQKKHYAISEYKKDLQVMDSLTKNAFEMYPQKPFILKNQKKIKDDYMYLKNTVPRAGNKYSANLFSSIIDFSMDQDQPQEEIMKIPFNFLQQILTHFASKAKPKIRNNYYMSDEEKMLNNMGDQFIQKFSLWLQSKEISDKILESSKQCNFSFNMISVLIRVIAKYSEAEKQQSMMEEENENEIEQLKSEAYNRPFSQKQLQFLVKCMLKSEKNLLEIRRARENDQLKSKEIQNGFFHTLEDFQRIREQYEQFMKHPSNLNRTKYKIINSEVPWSQEEYLKFLEKFYEFFNVPTNNKKIALMMGKSIEPNHVKHVKGLYMRNMSLRIENGEIGGGKKGAFESKLQFLKKDIENFSMRCFKKQARIKSKKNKKKKKKLSLDDDDDSDY